MQKIRRRSYRVRMFVTGLAVAVAFAVAIDGSHTQTPGQHAGADHTARPLASKGGAIELSAPFAFQTGPLEPSLLVLQPLDAARATPQKALFSLLEF